VVSEVNSACRADKYGPKKQLATKLQRAVTSRAVERHVQIAQCRFRKLLEWSGTEVEAHSEAVHACHHASANVEEPTTPMAMRTFAMARDYVSRMG